VPGLAASVARPDDAAAQFQQQMSVHRSIMARDGRQYRATVPVLFC
jgi:hypothetical protein